MYVRPGSMNESRSWWATSSTNWHAAATAHHAHRASVRRGAGSRVTATSHAKTASPASPHRFRASVTRVVMTPWAAPDPSTAVPAGTTTAV